MATQTQRDLFLKYMKSLVFWRKNSKINDNIFWECHKILRNHPHRSDIYQVKVKSKWAIFSNFVALSENLNFNAKSRTQEAQWQNAHQKATTPTTPTSPNFIRLICPNCSKHLGYVGKKNSRASVVCGGHHWEIFGGIFSGTQDNPKKDSSHAISSLAQWTHLHMHVI